MGLFSKIRGRLQHSGTQADTSSLDLEKHWLVHDMLNRRRGVYYFYKHKYVNYRVGDTLSLGVKKGKYPIYKVTAISKSFGSDPAGFDDQRLYDLKFVRWSSKPRIPTKEMMAR